MKKLSILACALVISICFQQCKKKALPNNSTSEASSDYLKKILAQQIPAGGTAKEKVMDSLLLYAQQVHLWNTYLPLYEDFKPRQYINNPAALIEAIKSYTPYLESTGKPIDKYSFLDDGAVAKELSGNNPGSFGLLPFYPDINHTDDLRVKIVDLNSPAANAGISRSDKILAINDNTNIGLVNGNAPSIVVDAFFGNRTTSIKLKIGKNNGSAQDITLQKSPYKIEPVLYSSILNINNSKVGYIVYTSFTLNSDQQVKEVINEFQAAGCNKIIVDLRYNGGGYVNAAENIGNLLVNGSANGKTQYVQDYNQIMQNNQASILKNQYAQFSDGKYYSLFQKDLFSPSNNKSTFKKSGSFNPDAIYFITTRSTASASELLINMLRPFSKVYIVGRQSYGKPVGFIGLRIGEFDVYYAMSKSSNADGFGDYFNGLNPDYTINEDMQNDWGDQNESLLKACIHHIINNTFPSTARAASNAIDKEIEKANKHLTPEEKSHNLFIKFPIK